MNKKFDKLGFYPADILLPKGQDMTKWAVVACDQFTSEPEYWQAVEEKVGDAPSTLRLILPEANLKAPNVDEFIQNINDSMSKYIADGVFETLTDSLTDALDAQNIDAQPLDLLTSTIPEDCNLLIINAPTSDFTAGDGLVDEISQLENYLAAGGKLLLTSSVYAQTPQLDAVLAQFGLARAEGMVVEGDSSKALYNSAWSLLPDYGTPTESTALNGVNTNTHVMLSVAQGITVTETEDVTAEPLLNSSSAAYAKADINDLTTMEREGGDTDGPFALAVWARNEDTGAEVLWIGCPNMDNEQLYQSMPGNLTFLQGCAASLVGQDILVDTKALEAEPITVAGSTAAALGLIFVFVLPAAVLIAGAVVVLLRRRR